MTTTTTTTTLETEGLRRPSLVYRSCPVFPSIVTHTFQFESSTCSCISVLHLCVKQTQIRRESVTVSVFILSGNMLKAAYSLDGPIAELGAESGLELYKGGLEFTEEKGNRQLALSETVDFEHLMDQLDDDDANFADDDDDDDDAVDDDVDPIKSDDPDAEKKRRERRERQRKKFLDAKKKREDKKLAQLKKVRQDGEPISITKKAPESGWYEFCVTAKWNQVS